MAAPRSKATRAAATSEPEPLVRVRRLHRRDLNRTWDFLKLVFREVNRTTVEYQRPRSKRRFLEVYEEEGVEQLLFVAGDVGAERIVGYSECAFEILGTDNWMNERYFRGRDMRPLYVEELAVHPEFQGRGLGSFVMDQLEHLARVRGCTHLVLEVAENNARALKFYRGRNFFKLDAAIFLAKKVASDAELLPARKLKAARLPVDPAVAAPVAPKRRSARAAEAAVEPSEDDDDKSGERDDDDDDEDDVPASGKGAGAPGTEGDDA
ncbi:MAG: GNAT family N-acetyltransferase [Polyangiaceae bacterium]|jgi:ribosomal protein S18 acetylase RimI-like enzyme|nr:GNAT family N-acetyltransferase [Polyangiaceae bacterium]